MSPKRKPDPTRQKRYAIRGTTLEQALRKVVEAGPYPDEARKHPSRSARDTSPPDQKPDSSES